MKSVWKPTCREEHRELARELDKQSSYFELSDTEKERITKLRREKRNENIFLSIQDTNIAVEHVDNENIIIHDLKKNKEYRQKWYQDLGMPIIAVAIPYVDVLYKGSLIYD